MQIYKKGHLLPNEPSLIQSSESKKLSMRYLYPALRQIEVFLLYLRKDVDQQLKTSQPFKSGKPYPLGQCLEISLAMKDRFKTMHLLRLKGDLAVGRGALVDYLRNGGAIRQIWGDLRASYFQNAFQIGSYYVDVSNDTVVATKPKVEILPFDVAGMSPIKDYYHYAEIAKRYWRAKIVPNHVIPELAPFAPLLLVLPGGRLRIKASSNYMLALVLREQFRICEVVIEQEPLDSKLFSALKQYMPTHLVKVVSSSIEGRLIGLDLCKQERNGFVSKSNSRIEMMMRATSNRIVAVNNHFSQFILNEEITELFDRSFEANTQNNS